MIKPTVIKCEVCDKKVIVYMHSSGLVCSKCRSLLRDNKSPEFQEHLRKVKENKK